MEKLQVLTKAAPVQLDCDHCRHADEHGFWGSNIPTHCRVCHRSWAGTAEIHCVVCHRHFSSDTALILHKRGPRDCVPPEEVCDEETGAAVFYTREGPWGVTYVRSGDRETPSTRG